MQNGLKFISLMFSVTCL